MASKMYSKCLLNSLVLLVWACCFHACRPVPQKGASKEAGWVQTLAFEELKIGATVGYQDMTGNCHSACIKLRIKKDRIIWFSISAPWGSEILRGTITPTSITLINHMQRTYYVYDYVTLCALWPGPWSYTLLQALLLGELAHAPVPHKVIQKNAQQIVVQQKKRVWSLMHFVNPTLRKVEKLIAAANQDSLVGTYSLFKSCPGGLLCKRATLAWYCHTASTQPTMVLTLKGMQPQWPKKPLRFPFAIPANYEKKHAILDW